MSSNNLRAEDLDRLGQALLTLTKELWVTKDRLRVLEAALVETGTLVPEAVDTFQPDEQLATTLETERAQLINQLLETLTPNSNDA
jgi:hypothetical protein